MPSLRGAIATKQSSFLVAAKLDCFASLAMTGIERCSYHGAFAPQKCAIFRQEPSHGADASPREVLPMSEVLPFQPKPPSKTIEEETREFLALLERIRSEGQKSK
jgi:hypothetical protein